MKTLRISLVFLLAIVLASVSFAQRQTGSLSGQVIDKEGNPLPGATVTIAGPSLLGVSSYVTSDTGLFRFPSLLPGEYEVRAEMPGFKTTIRKGLFISVGKTTEVTIELEVAAVEEEITVTAASPVVDVEASKVSVNYSAQFLASIPMNRDLYDIQNSVPGAISESVEYRRTSSILGGTVRSQLYALDGVPLNDPATFYSMANINVDVYDEIEFEVGAHPAEVGQTDSTYINIVSKSGGNKFSGAANVYYINKGFNEDLISKEDMTAMAVNPAEKFTDSKDFSANIGGPIVQDKIWFFLNGRRYTWDRANPGNAEKRMESIGVPTHGHYDYNHQEWLGFAKLTFQATKNIRYMGMLHYNHIYEPVYQNSGGGDTDWSQTEIWDNENTYTTTHQINWVLDQNTFLDLRGTYVWRHFPIPSREQNMPTYYDRAVAVYWGASPYSDEYIRKKILASASLTRFQDDFLGASHEFKAGAEFEQSEYHRDWWRGNPYYAYYYNYTINNRYYYSTSGRQGRLRIRYCPPTRGQWDVQDHVRRFSGYAQDSVTTGRLALNIGLRVDKSFQYEPEQSRPELRYESGHPFMNPDITDPNALLEALIDQWHTDIGPVSPWDPLTTPYKRPVEFLTFSPRIGIVYDLFGDGKTALKLSYARYYEPVWSAKYNGGQIFGAGSIDSYRWYDDNRNNMMDLPPTDRYIPSSYANEDPNYTYYFTWDSIMKYQQTGNMDDLKKGLHSPYTDEIMVGIEHELVKNFKLGLEFMWKQNKNIVEDIDLNNGYDTTKKLANGEFVWIPFTFIDPGWDGTWGTADDQQLTIYGLNKNAPVPTWVGTNPPDAKRKYWAVIMTFDKRMSNRWQLKGSILYSSFKGNCGAEYSPTEGESGMFDNPNTLINAYGSSWFDRPLQIKVMGTYILPYDFLLSAYLVHQTGSPWQRTLARVYFSPDVAALVQSSYYAVNAETPGSRRNAPYTNLDLRLEKTFSLGETAKLGIYLDLFNVAGRSGVNINGDPAAYLRFDAPPLDAADYQPSSTYSNITSIYGVRSMRLGVRFSF
jgi:hypothetical protein